MKVKKFEALDMPQALDMIKRELGPNAVILSTRKIRKSGGIFGLLSRPILEVTAASDYDFNAKKTIEEKGALKKDDMNWSSARFESLQDDINKVKSEVSTLMALKAGNNEEEDELKEFIANYNVLDRKVDAILKSAVENKLKNFPHETIEIYNALTTNKVEDALALKLIEFLEAKSHATNGAKKIDVMLKIIKSSIKTSGQIALGGTQKVVALVGPTGVGKTTTIAKLAAIYALQKKQKVGIITIDTYRIAAVEQVKTYAKILDIPVEVAMTEEDLNTALDNLKFKDLVLIDTAGMSPHNKKQMAELKEILTKRHLDLETHLVLSLTTSLEDLFTAVKKFSELNCKKLLFTKIDETTRYGNILNLSLRTQLPISYISNGQNVPEDIITAESEAIAKILLNMRAN